MFETIVTNRAAASMFIALLLFFIWAVVMRIRSQIRQRRLEGLQTLRMRHFLTTHSKLLYERRKVQKS